MSYEKWKETYEKILNMYSEFEELPKSPALSKCWKYQQDIQDAWEDLNNEYLFKFREELLSKIEKEIDNEI